MKAPKIPATGKQVLIVTAGVFLAGFIMNHFRSNDIVRKAISGYDS